MPTALICTQADLEPELGHTLLWREGIERHFAPRLEEARMMAVAARPDVILVDRELPRAEKLITGLREDPSTRGLSIVLLSRGDFDPAEVELLEAGANAILRLPADAGWEERLTRLMKVPSRKEARFPVRLAVEAAGDGHVIPALALNLSVNGMLLEAHEDLAVGTDLALSFHLHESDQGVRGVGRVVRRADSTRFGVEFGRIEADGRERIRAYVSGLKAA